MSNEQNGTDAKAETRTSGLADPHSRSPLGDLLGPNSFLKGEFTGDADLYVQGRVEGSITVQPGTLRIAGSARVKATVKARTVIIEGEVTGDVVATEKVVLEATARIIGKIVAPALQIASGAVLNGTVEVQGMAAAQSQVRRAA